MPQSPGMMLRQHQGRGQRGMYSGSSRRNKRHINIGAVATLVPALAMTLSACAPVEPASTALAQPSSSNVPAQSFDLLRDCSTCPQMVGVDGEVRFLQGPTPEEQASLRAAGIHSAGKQKIVEVRAFAVSRTEVTFGQFREFLLATGYRPEQGAGCTAYADEFPFVTFMPRTTLSFQNPGFKQTDNHPVVCVTIADAVAYVRWLSQITGHQYRLPTEAEWELLARATQLDVGVISVESDAQRICQYENVADESADYSYDMDSRYDCNDGYDNETSPVATYPANHLGVFDVIGNVAEYVGDCGDDYDQPAGQIRQWSPASGCEAYIIKGAGFLGGYPSTLPPGKAVSVGEHRVVALGFRVARDL